MRKIKIFSALDYVLLACVLALVAIGVAFIYSAAIKGGVLINHKYQKQVIWACIGLVFLCLFAVYDYRRSERYIFWIFIVSLIINFLTSRFSVNTKGANSWFGIGSLGIQPAELSKVIFIFFLAWYFSSTENEKPLKRFIVSLIVLFVQVIVVLLQHDLGTALVFFPIFIFMSYIAGIETRYWAWFLSICVLVVIFVMLPLWGDFIIKNNDISALRFLTSKKLRFIITCALGAIMLICVVGLFLYPEQRYFYWISYGVSILLISYIVAPVIIKVLDDYQKARLVIFINPSVDTLDAGWNIASANKCIGKGGLFGLGYLKGEYSHLDFTPVQLSDFILTIIAEEWGFFGCLLVLTLLVCILLRNVYIIKNSPNKYGTYIATGIFGLFFFHILENIGMNISLMPITGIPLPFVSYGGSSMISFMIAIGTLMAVRYRRFNFMD